ncbi:GH1 family beta-glucosidase [Propionibacteriaceae bacterium Y1923]|uniref:GH1 family beta-glucosidase n=1 Tax=Aestuariimicrobium sp. Y1814 TaxID=3418742 RepID=UPI003C2A840F
MNDMSTPRFATLTGARLPEGFVVGTATASYQIEGAVHEDGRGPSIWDTFSHTPGKTLNGDTGDVACDHYHRLDEDLDLMASYGLDAYRFSIAWPRIVPGGTGAVNQAGIDFYSRLVDGLLERGIKPVATLYHWDLPQVLEDDGGWPLRGTANAFANYAEVVGAALGDRVHQWTTLNEPWCAAYLGYSEGVHAPGRREPEPTLRAVHHLNLAHGLALQALRATVSKPDAQYSVTNNLQTVRPIDPDSADDLAAVARTKAMHNGVFTGPQLAGAYPELAIEATRGVTDWSFVLDGDLETIKQPIDVFGLNWYNPHWVGAGPLQDGDDGLQSTPGLTDLRLRRPAHLAQTQMGWPIDPTGLEEILLDLHAEFGDLPIAITENGSASDDVVGPDGAVHDTQRVEYLATHLSAVHRAIEAGVNVQGYFAWSLMDNFEWSWGYERRFGITHVDYETQVRTPKDSAGWLRELIRTRAIPSTDPASWG